MSADAIAGGRLAARIECGSCETKFVSTSSTDEAAYLAGVHNDLHHQGAGDEDRAQVVTAADLGWAAEPAVLADAIDQAVPFAGDVTASDRAWAARVDTAVQGMDVADPAGLDAWMQAHAVADAPHLAEAELVAAWESHVRAYYADDAASRTSVETAAVQTTEPSGSAAELVADEDGAWEL